MTGRTASRPRSRPHEAAKPGWRGSRVTSSTGTQARCRLSGSLMVASNGVTTCATTVVYDHTWVLNSLVFPL